VLLRCTQEIITNAVRPRQRPQSLDPCPSRGRAYRHRSRDDGAGVETVIPGNGLRGMRERLAQHGGELKIETGAGTGFRLHLSMPTLPLGAAIAPYAAPLGVTP
jgi:glucose-6-phosphate-specific signal transduction histidine kinase